MGNKELCEAAIKAIAEARAKGYNVLTADISLNGLSDWHVPVVETVILDADIKNLDIYPQQGKFAVTRQGLSKLAVAAGVIWSASETRRTDNRSCRDYVSFQAVGGIQKPDGTYTFMKAEYDLDMEVVEEELRNSGKDESKVRSSMIEKRKNKLKLCESGAKDRVIRELLGIRSTYTLDQIKKPFIILRITVRPDYSDKDVKQAMLTAAIQSMTGIYGGGAPPQITYDDPVIDIPQEPEPEPEPANNETNQGNSETKPSAIESAIIDFENADEFNQCRAITDCSLRKGYDLAGWQKRAGVEMLTALPTEKRLGLFKHIINLPDKEAGNVPY